MKKQRLAREYEFAPNGSAAAVTELQQKIGTPSKAEYDRLSHAADAARARSEQARLVLEQHIAAHRC